MHGEHHHHHGHHGCHEGSGGGQSRGPAWFYGYCHQSRQMRMMDYPDYMSNMQTTYANLYNTAASTVQPYMSMLQGMTPVSGTQPQTGQGSQAHPHGHHHHGHHHEHDCGCHERHEHDCFCGEKHEHHDCHCSCCVRCADAVEYARCGELRRIPLTFDNDTRRERDVKLQLGAFATESGQELGWEAALSETEFKLGPCGEKTVILTVRVDCSKMGSGQTAAGQNDRVPATVDSCKVAYGTLRAEGCSIRPLVIAVAVLPDDCGAHHAGCQCGCCCG